MNRWDQLEHTVREQLARRLLAAAAMLQSEAKRDYSSSNPAPHKTPAPRGEFPRGRTWNLRDAVEIFPRDLAEIARRGKVRVGITKNAFYGAILKQRGWKGIRDTYSRVKPALAKLLGGK